VINAGEEKMNKDKKHFEKIYENPNAVWTRKIPPIELVSLVNKERIKPCKAIDIACGEGYYSVYLALKGFDVTGIDLSNRAIAYAKENARINKVDIRFLQIDIENLVDLDEKFDFVLEWGFLHHVAPITRRGYIKNVADLLNKDGKYLSMCFNEQSPEFGGAGKKYRTTSLGTTLYYSSQNELEKLFSPKFNILDNKLIKISGGRKGISHIGNYFLMEKK
jgi:2-polyprenyl-3-methyl-5-hydroxy-6-metoxy-1,4-benzoquinol methylase